MRCTQSVAFSALVAYATAHGLVTSIEGANGVTMPGLSVADGTPRDCSSNRCGSQADTAIIRDEEIEDGECGPLGRTQGNGPISAETMIESFMGTGVAPKNNGPVDSVGVEDDIDLEDDKRKRSTKTQNGFFRRQISNLIGNFFGGGNEGEKADLPDETSVASTAGEGASSGLPTCDDDGTITMTFRQINQDGAGPLTADVDGTSGGTDPDAFEEAEVSKNVPGFGVGGLSLATNTDFPVEVKMPSGMTCDGTVSGVDNVCIVRVRNNAAAGPFGGSAAFTQSPEARKRAIAFRIKKRQQFNNRQ